MIKKDNRQEHSKKENVKDVLREGVFDRFDLPALKSFYKTATHGGFSKASRATGIAQPTLSVGVKRLEDHLGVGLIERDSKNFALTPAGISLLGVCQRLEGTLESFVLELSQKPLKAKRLLRLGCGYSIGYDLLTPLCEVTAHSESPLDLELSSHKSVYLLKALKDAEIDAALVPDGVHDSQLSFHKLREDHVIFVMDKSFERLLKSEGGGVESFEQVQLLTYPLGTQMRMLVDQIKVKNKLKFKSELTVQGYEGIKSLVQRKLGVAFMMKSLLEEEMKRLHLVEYPLPFRLPRRAIMLATRNDRAGQELAEYLLKVIRQN